MIKTVLFDIDGMIINREMRFSQRFSNDMKIPAEKMAPFFENEFKLCLIGKADVKEELKKYIKKWDWPGSIDELLQYWFGKENKVNDKILDSVKKLRNSGIKCFLITDNEKYRVDYILNNIGLKKYFDGIFSSGKINHLKSEQKFWGTVYDQLGKPEKNSVLCWDDDKKILKRQENSAFRPNYTPILTNTKIKLKTI